MNRLEHKTIEEHYNKYRDMADKAGLNFKNNKDYMGYMGFTKEQLLELYMEDNCLNNISLRDFDCFYLHYPSYIKKIITNLTDNVCVLKHLLIYNVLGAIPIFVEVGGNLKYVPHKFLGDKKMNRYFKREKYIGNTGIETEIDYWKWIKGKGLFVKYKYNDKFYKSEYCLRELLLGMSEGVITEIVPPNKFIK